MNTYPSHIPIQQLIHDSAHVPLVKERNEGFIHNYRTGKLITRAGLSAGNTGYVDLNTIGNYPALQAAVLNMARQLDGVVFQCWIGVLAPQTGDLDVHTDGALPGNPIRYHLPIRSNKLAKYWDPDVGAIHMIPGVWYGPIRYTEPHRAYNDGLSERWHLVADFLTGNAIQMALI